MHAILEPLWPDIFIPVAFVAFMFWIIFGIVTSMDYPPGKNFHWTRNTFKEYPIAVIIWWLINITIILGVSGLILWGIYSGVTYEHV